MWNDSARDQLSKVGDPWLHQLSSSSANAHELSWYLNDSGLVARVLSGKRMAELACLFGEIAAALQFPDYFGNNWPALAECLSDLEWLKGSAYVVVVTEAGSLLSLAPATEFDAFFKVLHGVSHEWAITNHPGATWAHQPIPFHVVLQDSPGVLGGLFTRLRSLGFESSQLTV